mgnify:CR=1 FL=1|jgi:predicted DNA-binding protein
MKNNLIKTSHYIDQESIQQLKALAEINSRSLGWTVRKCIEFGLKNSEKIKFHEPVRFSENLSPEWADFLRGTK